MKNKNLITLCLAICCLFAITNNVAAQQASVSFNKKGISVIFKIETSSPEATKQSLGSVYFTGYNDTEKESRVHRVLGDRASGVYFGYDLIIESETNANKFKVSIKPLSLNPPENLRLSDLTARSLPKYPEDMIVEDGDTIALDVLVNPQTKVKIVDLIKITRKKPQTSDVSSFAPTSVGSSGSGGNDNSINRQKARDFTPNDVKLRLTSPKLLINGALSSLLGSQWEGIIEGSVIYIFIPGKEGRFIFSLFPQNGYSFQKNAVVEDNKIIFQSNDERYEIISEAPIVSGGGTWNLWNLHDSSYRPDLIFSAAAAGHIEYGASSDVESILKQEWRKSRVLPIRPTKELIYRNWLDNDVRYIATDAERQAFSALNSDEERERFIESFWQRRDPKPETSENEFRRDYYSRMAYANEKFAFGETSGWLTDRGRIYITYGKPDSVEKTSTGEIWTYKSPAGLGDNVKYEFVSTAKNGEFRLRQ